jgi:hypothetical protein
MASTSKTMPFIVCRDDMTLDARPDFRVIALPARAGGFMQYMLKQIDLSTIKFDHVTQIEAICFLQY